MRQTIGLIAGASAVALAGVLAVQTGSLGDFGGEAPRAEPPAPAPVAAVPDPEPPAPEPPAPSPAELAASAAELEARIAALETTLADREAALAELGDTLSERDASLAATTEALSQRDADLAAATEALARRDADLAAATEGLARRDAEIERLHAELADLRLELADLRERFAFDIQLAAMKAGEPAAPVPAPAAEQPPSEQPPNEQAPNEQPLTTICFDMGSAALTPGGQVHAAAAAVMLADMKLGRIRLVGFTDRTGSPALNRTLAAARARAVADFLVAQGVPAQLIETAGVIEGDLPVPTEPGVPEPLNRSVSILAIALPTT